MTQQDQKGGPDPKADGTRPHWTSRWRSHYRPGTWLVLSGPTSMVVMQPAAPQWTDLINAVWEDVVDSASLKQIAGRMAEFRLDQMPDFAALFWDAGTMRSLVRGRVRLIDPDSGRSVADGEGVMTWSEVGLGDLQQVRIEAGEQDDGEQLELPLVIGAVNASQVLLDCSDEAQIFSPQGTFVGDPTALDRVEAEAPEPDADESAAGTESAESGPGAGNAASVGVGAAAVGAAAGAGIAAHAAGSPDQPGSPDQSSSGQPSPTQPDAAAQHSAPQSSAPDQSDSPDQSDAHVPSGAPQQPGPVAPGAPSPTPSAGQPSGASDGNTAPAPTVPGSPNGPGPQPPRQVLGVLHPSSGGSVEVDRPVVIGRSPVASRVRSDQLPRLLTVPSPSHDISRTHVQVAPENGRLMVTDLNSTNGTILVLPDGRRADLRPGVGVPLDYGCVIDLGDGITIAVDRQ